MKVTRALERSVKKISDSLTRTWWRDPKFFVPLFVSLVAVALSGFAIYLSWSPFNVRVFNSFSFVPNLFVDYKKYFPEGLNLGINFNFVNQGKNSGVIEDVFVNVQNANSRWERLRPVAQNDLQEIASDCGTGSWGVGFDPFVLGGEKDLQKMYFFALGNIEVGKYVVEWHVRSGSKELRGITTLEITEQMRNLYMKKNMLLDVDEKSFVIKECK